MNLDSLIFLTQSDTTVGFLSKDTEKLNALKGRPLQQKILMEVPSLRELQFCTRVPKVFTKLVRRSRQITFIYPNQKSFRIIKDSRHLDFLEKTGGMYSTSANPHKSGFDPLWASHISDVVILDSRGLKEGKSSRIYKLSKTKIRRIR